MIAGPIAAPAWGAQGAVGNNIHPNSLFLEAGGDLLAFL
jgi:hypothetical protein